MKTEKYNQAIKEYYNRLFRFVVRRIPDREAAKDIVQDCFMKLWQERMNIDETKIKTWLFKVAYNASLNYIKKESRTESSENMLLPDRGVIHKPAFELQEVIDIGMECLSDLQKSILLLRDLEGYDYKEIGEVLNLSPEQVKVYLFRARQKVKNKIKDLSAVL